MLQERLDTVYWKYALSCWLTCLSTLSLVLCKKISPAAPEVMAATVGPEPDRYAASAPAEIAASIIGFTFSLLNSKQRE